MTVPDLVELVSVAVVVGLFELAVVVAAAVVGWQGQLQQRLHPWCQGLQGMACQELQDIKPRFISLLLH